MKSFVIGSALTIVLGIFLQSSEPTGVIDAPVEVVNSVCDDTHIRYVCVECDSMEFQHLVEYSDSVSL